MELMRKWEVRIITQYILSKQIRGREKNWIKIIYNCISGDLEREDNKLWSGENEGYLIGTMVDWSMWNLHIV